MTYPTCKTCDYWTNIDSDHACFKPDQTGKQEVRICGNPNLGFLDYDSESINTYRGSALSEPDNYVAYLLTTESFGCICHSDFYVVHKSEE